MTTAQLALYVVAAINATRCIALALGLVLLAQLVGAL